MMLSVKRLGPADPYGDKLLVRGGGKQRTVRFPYRQADPYWPAVIELARVLKVWPEHEPVTVEEDRRTYVTYHEDSVVAVATVQFSWGGLFDSRPADRDIHLVPMLKRGGTPGPTLCGIDRFSKTGPGFSVGGGVSDPHARACAGCLAQREAQYPGAPVWGSMFGPQVFADLPASPWNHREQPIVGIYRRPAEENTNMLDYVAVRDA